MMGISKKKKKGKKDSKKDSKIETDNKNSSMMATEDSMIET